LLLLIFWPVVVFLLIALIGRFVYPGYPRARKSGALKSYGSWALVTGASAGIGTEFARQIAKEGINVILVARRKDRLEEVAQELKSSFSVETRVVTADLGSRDGAYQLYKAVKDLNLPEGGPGLIVNNAGFGWFGIFQEQEIKHIEEMIQLNVTSVAVLTRLFLDDLNKRTNRGGMIITSSTGSYFPGPLASLYDATKVFDTYLAVGLHGEQKYLNKSKVDFLALEPGGTTTEFASVSGAAGTNVRSSPSVVVNAALNALVGGFPSIIPVHYDHFTTYLSMLPRPIALPLVLNAFRKISGKTV
jgi:hypothetical protein